MASNGGAVSDSINSGTASAPDSIHPDSVALSDSIPAITTAVAGSLPEDTASAAKSNPSDSVAISQSYPFSYNKIMIPAIMAGAGYAFTFFHHRKWVNHGVQQVNKGHKFRVDDYAQILPLGAALFAGSLNVPHKHNFIDRTIITATSTIIMAAITRVIKENTTEARPGGSPSEPFKHGSNSFPSGHTATAFTGAELCRLEYGGATGIAAYSVAALIGALRIYNNKHWLNDVLAGAGIGILSARAGVWLLPYEKKLVGKISHLFSRKKKHLPASSCVAIPYLDGIGGYGCAISVTI